MDLIVAQYESSSSNSSCAGSSDEEEPTVSTAQPRNNSDSASDADVAGKAAGRKRKRSSEVPWVRAFAHVDGNWPSHVHVSINKDAELRALCDRVISGAQQSIVDAGCSDTDAALVPMDDYHLSLSRPFVLQYDQIGTFVDELRAALKWRRRFVVALSEAAVLVNDEQTRSFLALRVSGGEKELLATIKCVDKCMKQLALPLYYEDPIPHVSIASALGHSLPEQLTRAQVHMLFLNETPWSAAITTVHIAIGNKQFQIPLQE